MFKLKVLYAAVIASGLAISSSHAVPISQTWNGSNRFESEQFFFDVAFTASALTSITGPGLYRDEGETGHAFSLSISLDGVWTEIWNSGDTLGTSGEVSLSDIAMPISFPIGLVDGIWLAMTPGGFDGFRQMAVGDGLDTVFTFEAAVAEVPVPAAWPLFIPGLAVVALLSRRKRKAVAAA